MDISESQQQLRRRLHTAKRVKQQQPMSSNRSMRKSHRANIRNRDASKEDAYDINNSSFIVLTQGQGLMSSSRPTGLTSSSKPSSLRHSKLSHRSKQKANQSANSLSRSKSPTNNLRFKQQPPIIELLPGLASYNINLQFSNIVETELRSAKKK